VGKRLLYQRAKRLSVLMATTCGAFSGNMIVARWTMSVITRIYSRVVIGVMVGLDIIARFIIRFIWLIGFVIGFAIWPMIRFMSWMWRRSRGQRVYDRRWWHSWSIVEWIIIIIVSGVNYDRVNRSA
jgi:hypothetical protein